MRAAMIFGLMLPMLTMVAGAQADRLVRGQPVADPEWLTGRWIAPDGRGGWLEIAIELTARTPVNGSLAKGPFLLDSMQVEVCRGPNPLMQAGQCNYFSDDAGGGLRMGRSFLELHLAAEFGFPGLDVDLRREGQAWVGWMHRGEFSGQVRLEGGGSGGLTGSWQSASGRECLHLAERPEGMMASLDQLSDPRTMRYANRIQPGPLLEIFGRFVTAGPDGAEGFNFEIETPMAGRTIHLREGRRVSRGKRVLMLTGRLQRDPMRVDLDWMRVRGATCRAQLHAPAAKGKAGQPAQCEVSCGAR